MGRGGKKRQDHTGREVRPQPRVGVGGSMFSSNLRLRLGWVFLVGEEASLQLILKWVIKTNMYIHGQSKCGKLLTSGESR